MLRVDNVMWKTNENQCNYYDNIIGYSSYLKIKYEYQEICEKLYYYQWFKINM